MPDIYLDAEERMTAGQRSEFLAAAAVLFPRLIGAKVADILAIVSDEDWECGAIEATYATYAEDFVGLGVPAVCVGLLAAKIMRCDARQTVYNLARERTGRDA